MDHVETTAGLDLLAALEPPARRAVRHFLRCGRCRLQLVAAIETAEVALTPPVAPAGRVVEFEPMWRRLAEKADRAAAERKEEQRQVAGLLAELQALGPDERLLRLEGEPRYWTLALAQALRQEAEQALEPVEARALAEQARAIALRLPEDHYGRSAAIDQLALAWCAEAEARRRMGDDEGTERALAQAEECLEDEPLDAPARAAFCLRLALLVGSRGQVDAALGLLGRAADLWEEHQEFGPLGETLTARGWICLAQEEPHLALPALQAAISLLEPTRSPHASLRARYGLALAYAVLGRQPEADAALERALTLLDELEVRDEAPGFRWLQAHVLERTGHLAEAVEVLSGLLQDLTAGGAHYDALLAGLELARCKALRGEGDAAGQALREANDRAERAGLAPPGRAAVAFVARFALPLSDRPGLLPALVTFLLRARHRPDRRFTRGNPARAEYAWEDLDLRLRAKLCQQAGLSRGLAHPAADLDDYARELLSLTAEEIAKIRLTFEAPMD